MSGSWQLKGKMEGGILGATTGMAQPYRRQARHRREASTLCAESTVNAGHDPVRIGQHEKGTSVFGVRDMVGNVWQYTDSFRDDHTRAVLLRGSSRYNPRVSEAFPAEHQSVNWHPSSTGLPAKDVFVKVPGMAKQRSLLLVSETPQMLRYFPPARELGAWTLVPQKSSPCASAEAEQAFQVFPDEPLLRTWLMFEKARISLPMD